MTPPTPRLTTARLMIAQLLASVPFWLAAPSATAHTWPTGTMTVVHPWTDAVPAGTERAVVRLGIVEVQADDRLLGATTDIAERIELVLPSVTAGQNGGAPSATASAGVAVVTGEDLVMDERGAHFVLHGIRRDLGDGNEYSLTLHFERAGDIDAAIVISPHD